MENKFINGMKKITNMTETENGAKAYKSTNSALVDLFGTIGALRNRNEQEIVTKFTKAYSEDALLAMKMLFYARDIREGLGERDTFRTILHYMCITHPIETRKNLAIVPFFGRWDDLYAAVGTPLEDDAFQIIRTQLSEDMQNALSGKPVSLLAKWLKSVGNVSYETQKLGKLTAHKVGLTYSAYRKTLSFLRKHLKIVEQSMSEKEWSEIQYEKLPALAMQKYMRAFYNHDEDRFKDYINQVQHGKAKINAGTLYPYNIIHKADLTSLWNSDFTGDFTLEQWSPLLEEQWKALPNYVSGENNVLVMADTSGSMTGRPLETSIGLAIYFAERNKGAWKDKFLTFAGNPSFVELKGTNLLEKVRCIPDICDNTNIAAAFELILKTALLEDVTQEEMPKALVIISDMEFDDASVSDYRRVRDGHNALMDQIADQFEQCGYKMPTIVYWNVESRHDLFQADANRKNTIMVSGQSPTTFQTFLHSLEGNPTVIMNETLNRPRYDIVQI